jgi:cobalt-zinc-cadmium efflux system outer membrane protein
MSFRTSGGVLCALLLISQTYAEPSTMVTLSNVHDLVRSNHPGLAAAQFSIREAVGRSLQSGRLANPEFETSFERHSSTNEGRVEIGLSQAFPVTARLRLEKQLSATSILAAEAEVRDAERRWVAQARRIVVDILANQAQRELLRQQASLAAELADHLKTVALKGEGSSLDAGQAQLTCKRFELQLHRNDAARLGLFGELKPLIGLDTGESFTLSGSLPPVTSSDRSLDPARRADYQAAQLEEETANHRVALERARRYEDIEAGLFTARERTEDFPAGSDDESLIGIRFKFPLPLWNQNDGAILEAQASHERRRMERATLEASIRVEADTALLEMRQWADALREIDDALIPLAKKQTALMDNAYRNGQASIQELLKARENQLELSSSQIDTLREFHLARVRYESALGYP